MRTNDQIFARHPELLELREFNTVDEIVKYLEDNTDLWQVQSAGGAPGGVAQDPIVVASVDTYEGTCKDLRGEPTYLEKYEFAGKESFHEGFVTDMQCVPEKAVFSTREGAEAYSTAVKKAFAADLEWQATVSQYKKEADDLDAANEADMDYLDQQSWDDLLGDAPQEEWY